jgi:hypothetical protein
VLETGSLVGNIILRHNIINRKSALHIVTVKPSLYAMQAPRERVNIALLLILDLGTRWGEWSASRPSHALPPVK